MSKQLKKDPQFKDMSILMLTGIKEQTGFDFKPKTGKPDWCSADAYLEKPVAPNILLAEVEKLLSGRDYNIESFLGYKFTHGRIEKHHNSQVHHYHES